VDGGGGGGGGGGGVIRIMGLARVELGIIFLGRSLPFYSK